MGGTPPKQQERSDGGYNDIVRPFARHALNVLTTLCIVLGVASALLWPWSYLRVYQIARATPLSADGFCLAQGELTYFHAERYMGTFPRSGLLFCSIDVADAVRDPIGGYGGPYVLGGHCTWVRTDGFGGASWSVLSAQLPQLADAFALLALMRFVRRQRWTALLGLVLLLSAAIMWGFFRYKLSYVLVLAVPAALQTCVGLYARARAAKRRRMIEAGLCPACGYDLRATPNRCPECGAIPARSNQSIPAASNAPSHP
jgi:hypothetical protein